MPQQHKPGRHRLTHCCQTQLTLQKLTINNWQMTGTGAETINQNVGECGIIILQLSFLVTQRPLAAEEKFWRAPVQGECTYNSSFVTHTAILLLGQSVSLSFICSCESPGKRNDVTYSIYRLIQWWSMYTCIHPQPKTIGFYRKTQPLVVCEKQVSY